MPAFSQMLSPTARRALRTWSPTYLLQIDTFDPDVFKVVGAIHSTPHGHEGTRPVSSPRENEVEPNDWGHSSNGAADIICDAIGIG